MFNQEQSQFFLCFIIVMMAAFFSRCSMATAPADGTLIAQPQTVILAVNRPELNRALTGREREVRIENTGQVVARNVKYTKIDFPDGMSVTPLTCGDIPPQATCILKITPGVWASDKSQIRLKGENTDSLSIPVRVLTYGSVYQGGYVFSIEDDVSGVKGKVLSLSDQVSPIPGVVWSSNGRSGRAGDGVFDAIAGVYDQSFQDCQGRTDGACNTDRIVSYYSRPVQYVPIALKYYAAGVCKAYLTDEQGGTPCAHQPCLGGWYLPAICELDRQKAFIPESISCPEDMQNVVENLGALIDINCAGPSCLAGTYWSSTAHYNRGYPEYSAWSEDFNSSGSSQYNDDKNNQYGVRCVRAF
jgi:hypothetical protein